MDKVIHSVTPVSSEDFINFGKNYVRQYSLEMMAKEDYKSVVEDFDVFVVWYSKALKNHKGLFATNLKDNLYYEITYNGDTNVYYFDAYDKKDNRTIVGPGL